MDVCADPAEVAALYGDTLQDLTALAAQLADAAAAAPGLTHLEKIEAVERLSQVVRRNALVARHLCEPLRTAAAPARSPGNAKPAKERTLREMSDEELDVLYAEAVEREAREERERIERERRETLPNRPIPEIIDRSCRDLGLGPFAEYQKRYGAGRRDKSPEPHPPSPDDPSPITDDDPSPGDRRPEPDPTDPDTS